jgi:hypothetical protein
LEEQQQEQQPLQQHRLAKPDSGYNTRHRAKGKGQGGVFPSPATYQKYWLFFKTAPETCSDDD